MREKSLPRKSYHSTKKKAFLKHCTFMAYIERWIDSYKDQISSHMQQLRGENTAYVLATQMCLHTALFLPFQTEMKRQYLVDEADLY